MKKFLLIIWKNIFRWRRFFIGDYWRLKLSLPCRINKAEVSSIHRGRFINEFENLRLKDIQNTYQIAMTKAFIKRVLEKNESRFEAERKLKEILKSMDLGKK